MTLLTAVQNACLELALPSPATVINNSDQTAAQMLALANREGKEMMAYDGVWGGWPELRKQYTFTLNPLAPITATTTKDSTALTNLSSSAGIAIGFGIAGNGIPQSAVVQSSPDQPFTSLTMSIAATSTANNVSIQMGQVAYPLPSDLQYFITQTGWDRNFRWQLLGPLDAQEWQVLLSGLSAAGPRLRFRVMPHPVTSALSFYINPVPGASQTDQIAYEYISKNFIYGGGGTTLTLSAFASDADTYAWPDDILILGIKWRFLKAKGLEYAEDKEIWEAARDRQAARSGGSRAIPLNATARGLRLLSNVNIPDTGFGT